MTEPYEVFAIRYATVARRSADNFIGGDAHESGARTNAPLLCYLAGRAAALGSVDVDALADAVADAELP